MGESIPPIAYATYRMFLNCPNTESLTQLTNIRESGEHTRTYTAQ